MQKQIFFNIDYKLLEILLLIEHEPSFPIFKKDLDNYINFSKENSNLYALYEKITEIRKIIERS